MRMYKPTYSKLLPDDAKVLRRKDGKYAKFRNRRGKLIEARLTKNGNHILIETSHWHIVFADTLGIKRDLKGFTNEAATKKLADNVQRLLNCKANGDPLDGELLRWLERVPRTVRDELIRFGLLDAQASRAGKPLNELVNDYIESLEAKDRSEKHIKNTWAQLKRLSESCGFHSWTDINPNRVITQLKAWRDGGMSIRRSNSYLTAAKMFCGWMVTSGYATQSPIRHLKALNTETDRRHERRALTLDGFKALLRATKNGKVYYGMSGHERYLLYRLVAETGLRADEARSLTKGSFDFGARTVEVKAGYSKRRKTDVQYISKGLANELEAFMQSKMPTAKAFGGTYQALTDKTAEMLRGDLDAAHISYEDESGRVFDFHGLRGECASLLVASGASPKTVQSILRHSDINLTMNTYTHTLRGQEAQAVESLPDLSICDSEPQESQKTGTDDSGVTSESLSKSCFGSGQQRTTTNCNEPGVRDERQETPIPDDAKGAERIRNPLLCPTELRALKLLSACNVASSHWCCQPPRRPTCRNSNVR